MDAGRRGGREAMESGETDTQQCRQTSREEDRAGPAEVRNERVWVVVVGHERN